MDAVEGRAGLAVVRVELPRRVIAPRSADDPSHHRSWSSDRQDNGTAMTRVNLASKAITATRRDARHTMNTKRCASSRYSATVSTTPASGTCRHGREWKVEPVSYIWRRGQSHEGPVNNPLTERPLLRYQAHRV